MGKGPSKINNLISESNGHRGQHAEHSKEPAKQKVSSIRTSTPSNVGISPPTTIRVKEKKQFIWTNFSKIMSKTGTNYRPHASLPTTQHPKTHASEDEKTDSVELPRSHTTA